MKYWILLADAARARIHSAPNPAGPFTLEREIENPDGRLRTQELVSDQPGRLRKGETGIHSAMDPRTTAHAAARQRFANRLADLLHREAIGGSFEKLVIAAPPQFLGELRPLLTNNVERRLRLSVPKDFTAAVHPEELSEWLGSLMGAGATA